MKFLLIEFMISNFVFKLCNWNLTLHECVVTIASMGQNVNVNKHSPASQKLHTKLFINKGTRIQVLFGIIRIYWSNLPLMNSLNHSTLMGCLASVRFIRNLFNEKTNITQPGIQNAGNKLCFEDIFFISFQLYVNFNVFTILSKIQRKFSAENLYLGKIWNCLYCTMYNVHHY